MQVSFLDLKAVNAPYTTEMQAASRRFLESGWYVLGEETRAFEEEYARFCGTKHAVGVSNGLDALRLIFEAAKVLGKLAEGDEVLVPANTYIASILAITQSGLRPVLVEPDRATYNIDVHAATEAVGPRTRAILAVHLYGQLADMEALSALAQAQGLLLFEDAAQAHGARLLDGRCAGNLSLAAGHSFYPGKNLGALGEAGAVTTSDAGFAEAVATLRNYGSQQKYYNRFQGFNMRIDELQAAFLRIRLRGLDKENERRRELAALYRQEIKRPDLVLPHEADYGQHVYHLFPILHPRRDALQAYLRKAGIQTMIHYPLPPHKQEAYAQWKELSLPFTEQLHREELSLPISPCHSDEEIHYVAHCINHFEV